MVGYVFFLLGFLVMLLLWRRGDPYWAVALAYSLVGLGVGFAGTPGVALADGSVPVHRAGMASGTADLQRDLGGAVMQSILGALLTLGYATAMAPAVAQSPNAAQVTDDIESQLRSRSPVPRRSRSSTRSTPKPSWKRPKSPFCRVRTGHMLQGS